MKKNSMKKAAALAMSAAMVMSMGAAASAATLNTEKEGAPEQTVGIYAYSEWNDTLPVVSVDMSYGAMKFVWRDDSKEGVWDPSTHTYVKDANDEAATEGENVTGWYPMFGSNTITLTNHSNVKVTYDVSIGEMIKGSGETAGLQSDAETTVRLEYKEANGDVAEDHELYHGIPNEPENADYNTIIVTLEGNPGGEESFAYSDFVKICELTVKLTKFSDYGVNKEI